MIEGSVGRNGLNRRNDALAVQSLLNAWKSRQAAPPIKVDGIVGPQTIAAITSYQQGSGLSADGRIDAGGPTETQMLAQLGEHAVFFHSISRMKQLAREFRSRAHGLPPQYLVLTSDILAGIDRLPFDGPVTSTDPMIRSGFVGGAVRPIGAIPLVAAAGILLVLYFLASMMAILMQSPEYKRAASRFVSEMSEAMNNLSLSVQERILRATQIILSIYNEAKDDASKCRNSPHFLPSPECAEAMTNYVQVFARTKTPVKEIVELVQLYLASWKSGRVDMRRLVYDIETLQDRVGQNLADLQAAVADMKDKCKCEL